MRLKRNYVAAIRRKIEWLSSRFKPLTVHTETIMIDQIWRKVQEKVNRGKVEKWYVMTPVNKDYFKSEFNIKLSEEKLSKIMKDRYRWMLKEGQKLELHIHLSMVMSNMSYKEQEKLFRESIRWMRKELGIVPKEFVPGWWTYDDNTLKLCKKFGLKMIYPRDYDFVHDYDWI